MATFGNKWQIQATNGNFWQQMATFGVKFWQQMATSGNKWQLLATNGNFWHQRATFGIKGRLLERSGIFLQQMATFVTFPLWRCL